MKIRFAACLALGVLLLAGCSMEITPPNPSVLVDTERAFAARTAAEGMKAGFTEYAADEGVMFSPGVVNVKEFYREREGGPALLSWEPIYAEIASSGDLGWTTGPWEYRADPNGADPDVSGHYISIWRLQADSSWRFVVDVGIAHNPHQAAAVTPVLRALVPVDEQGGDRARAKESLTRSEYTFSAASENDGYLAAYQSYSAEDIRLYRSGEYPTNGTQALAERLSDVGGVWTWEPGAVEVSNSGDLGYVYGVSKQVTGETARLYSYVHIWRKGNDGLWQLALDVHIPLPPTTEETKG